MRPVPRSVIIAAVLAPVLAFALPGAFMAAHATEIRSVTADEYGNAIIRTAGGAKIIAVGQADLATSFAEADAVPAATNCREVGIILRGRSYMYGVSDGDPVPLATRIICD
jgi:hypothetical protein